ncbi:MAG: 6-phosphofructokinase [Zoogloea oleivorans]|jgi:6-phosphofructokinase 1|uniref:6-phosphofructokinase n=1 Tax=Zoogloea oleivorans TaxID=1552750 RepID=UPI002A370C7A|nr:6-phosphofructokinase [Zoogloea oleivorans]MDY0034744.1 6-phosphofructokinase [Zoogloea oleivorans]
MTRNLLYAQSGGVTAVINASAAGVIATARQASGEIGQVLAARNGILGVLRETLVDTAGLSVSDLAHLRATPGGAFGSCRFDLDPAEQNPAQYDRLFAVLAAHDVGYFLYNGGNGSMETCRQIQAAADARSYPLRVVGVPKTVDNDIVLTDCCPGFGSAAKYLATSIREVGLDLDAMTTGSGRAFVLEVMGRNAGWLAAACALAAEDDDAAPHLILLPEVLFDEAAFLEKVTAVVERLGSCAIVVAEGIRGQDGQILSMQDRNQKGYIQLGGAGEVIAERIHACLGYKVHFALADYLQRSARHIASKTDTAQAFGVGKAAVRRALGGGSGVVGIERLSDTPYLWRTTLQTFDDVANLERQLPPEFITPDGFGVTDAFRRWCRPLIAGEDWPPFRDGLPDYLRLQLPLVPARLPPYVP